VSERADHTIKLEVISPARTVISVEAESVTVPAEDGLLGILPRHAPTVVLLAPGVLSYASRGESHRLAVGGGFCEITGDRVLVVADTAERSEEIDVERARAAYEQAKARLDRELSGHEQARAEAALKRAVARLQAAGAWRRRYGYAGRPGQRRMPTEHERDQ